MGGNMEKPQFVYVTYIMTTPEKLWNALMDGEMTKQYWGRARNVSDWKPGSAWRHEDYDDAGMVKVVGTVVESIPPKRLILTWASPSDATNRTKHSRVTFEIEPMFGAVRLTVVHDELEPGSETLRGITQGWPAILSSLKTLLETGQPMPGTTRRWGG
jgi:uncharacterized protein YndB with AHSA1/START domain